MLKADRAYSISELAREFGITPRALRFYEDKGLLTPARDGLNRVYSHRDRARLQLILRGKRVGLSLQEIKEILDLYAIGDGQRQQLQTALKRFKGRLQALEEQKQDLDEAIAVLMERIRWVEDRLAEPAPAAQTAAARAYDKEARRRLEDAT
jgi:DNA-binding transcriptional MerR regulator